MGQKEEGEREGGLYFPDSLLSIYLGERCSWTEVIGSLQTALVYDLVFLGSSSFSIPLSL